VSRRTDLSCNEQRKKFFVYLIGVKQPDIHSNEIISGTDIFEIQTDYNDCPCAS
jgi:hypothetical protein